LRKRGRGSAHFYFLFDPSCAFLCETSNFKAISKWAITVSSGESKIGPWHRWKNEAAGFELLKKVSQLIKGEKRESRGDKIKSRRRGESLPKFVNNSIVAGIPDEFHSLYDRRFMPFCPPCAGKELFMRIELF